MSTDAVSTEVRPFSNGTEADYWEWRNCSRCTKCGEPDETGVGPCAIETAVSMGRILGTIPTEIATRVGATIRAEYCDMPKECAELDLVMICECITDRRKRSKPQCGQPATSIATDGRGYRHPVCEKHRCVVEQSESAGHQGDTTA